MIDPESDPPPAEAADAVYGAYGAVMHAVQYWELALALRWWRMQTPPRDSREAESRAAAKAVARLEAAFTRVTASQARKDLEGHMPEELLGAAGELIGERNRLAHRFLREQQLGGNFRPGTLAGLGQALGRFDAAIQLLSEDLAQQGDYTGQVRAHWPALGEELAARLFAGEPVDLQGTLERSRQAARNDPPDPADV